MVDSTQYCQCYVPMRSMIDVRGCQCRNCKLPITTATYEHFNWPVEPRETIYWDATECE